MKSLLDYINEASSEKTSEKYFRLVLNKFEDFVSLVDKILVSAEKNGIYAEKTEDGCKIKLNSDSKVSSIIEICKSIIDFNKEKEGMESAIENIQNKINAIIEYTTPNKNVSTDEDTPSKKEEE